MNKNVQRTNEVQAKKVMTKVIKHIAKIDRKKIYNPDSTETVNERRVFGGNPNGMFEIAKVKYLWADNLWKVMENNTWFTKEPDLTGDAIDYLRLTKQEKRMYDLVLSQLIFMDSLQTNNLIDNVNPFITAPEINLILVRQAYEEANHSKGYAVMVDGIAIDSQAIYDMPKVVPELRAKNDFIAGVFMGLSENLDDESIVLSMFANQILEGIYFYAGFTALYVLARQGKMLGSADMIRFIQRDEVTHLLLFQNMINSVRKERPELFTDEFAEKVYEMFRQAVELEINWGKHLISEGGILGLNDKIFEDYIKHLANDRLEKVGYPALYPNVKHPIKWVDDFSKFNDQRTNFFEGTVKNYSKGELDWDEE